MMLQGMIAAYTFPRSMRVFIVGNALFLISVRLVFSRYPISQIWYKVRSWSAIIPAISPARAAKRVTKLFGCSPSRVSVTGCSNA